MVKEIFLDIINKIIKPYTTHIAIATTKAQLKEATQILLNNNIKYRVVSSDTSSTGILLKAPQYDIKVRKEDAEKAERLILSGGNK